MIYAPPILAMLFGSTLLLQSWRRRLRTPRVATALGWVFVLGSALLWARISGGELASLAWLLAVPLTGLGLTIASRGLSPEQVPVRLRHKRRGRRAEKPEESIQS